MLLAALADPWFDGWKGIQAAPQRRSRARYMPVPILSAKLAAEGLVKAGVWDCWPSSSAGARSAPRYAVRPRAVARSRRDRQRPRPLADPPVYGEERDRARPPPRRAVPHKSIRTVVPVVLPQRRVGAPQGHQRGLDGDRLQVEFAAREHRRGPKRPRRQARRRGSERKALSRQVA